MKKKIVLLLIATIVWMGVTACPNTTTTTSQSTEAQLLELALDEAAMSDEAAFDAGDFIDPSDYAGWVDGSYNLADHNPGSLAIKALTQSYEGTVTATVSAGAKALLAVAANATAKIEPSEFDKASGDVIELANGSYLYVEVTAEDGATKAYYRIAVTVTNTSWNARAPTISVHPASANYSVGASSVTALTVTAALPANETPAGTLSYVWYSAPAATGDGTPVTPAATLATFTPPVTSVGTTYYYVRVTNTNSAATGTKTAFLDSNRANITVTPPFNASVTITGSGTTFTAMNGATPPAQVATGTISAVIDTIRAYANGQAVNITFGGAAALDIGEASASFSGVWGALTLGGSITSANTTATEGTVGINDAITATINATIANTGQTANASRAVYIGGTSTVTISGGTYSQTGGGNAVYTAGTSNVTINGGSFTSANEAANTTSGTVCHAGDSILKVLGGTITNTSSAANARNLYNSTGSGASTPSDTAELTIGSVTLVAESTARNVSIVYGIPVYLTGTPVMTGGTASIYRSSATPVIIQAPFAPGANVYSLNYGNTDGQIMVTGGGPYLSNFSVITGTGLDVEGEDLIRRVAVTVSSIAVTGPTKTTYKVGETLDTTGLVITATMSNSTTQNIPIANVQITPAAAAFTASDIGTVTYTVTYQTRTTTFNVTVEPLVTVSSIVVKTDPTKIVYDVGETADFTGLVITATKSDTTTEDITDIDALTITPAAVAFAVADIGPVEYTVTYGGQTVKVTVTVNGKPSEAELKVEFNPADFSDLAPELDTGIILSHFGTTQVVELEAKGFETVKWIVGGAVKSTEDVYMLKASDFSLGLKTIRVEVTTAEGRTYSKTITFKVTL